MQLLISVIFISSTRIASFRISSGRTEPVDSTTNSNLFGIWEMVTTLSA